MLVRVKAGLLISDLPPRSGTLQAIAAISGYHCFAHGVFQVRLNPKDVHMRGSSRVRVGDDTSRDGRVPSKPANSALDPGITMRGHDHKET